MASSADRMAAGAGFGALAKADELKKLFLWLEEEGLRPAVDRILPLEEVSTAHQLLEERKVAGRIVLDINKKIWK